MFRIESYITSIILSYFDRYIKNFRQQDAQVSLWEGDGSFTNLNLDLEVLEEELNLPFSFISGHIHELLIHVPWTRLTSEPVQITINTIECVMKLKPAGSQHVRHPSRRSVQAMDDPQSQSSLVSSLVNKIICNVSITCNNLILKYVEEDIVLSMNIKTLSFGTVNNSWEPAFMELSPSQLELRKLISLSDVTVCLDKRNASGRIESYLEPLLYRCFITIRLCQSYPSAGAKRASSTRLDVLCERMAFTVSEPQLPMLLRLMSLCLALQRKQFSNTNLGQHATVSDDATGEKDDLDSGSVSGNPEESWSSWSTWAFGWMPALIPMGDDLEGDESDPFLQSSPPVSIFNFGFYIDTFTLALKLCESDTSGGMKTQSQAFMHLLLRGCRMDLLSHNSDWTNVQMGICQATVKPDGDCCCGVAEPSQLVYLSSGSVQEEFLSGSLFDKTPCRLQDRLGHSWKYHLESVSEAIMLEKTPAFAVDYLSCIQDKFEETESEDSDDEDTERLPPKEKVVIRYVAGPTVIRVCSGLIHRLQMLMKACDNYDYVPYTTNTNLPAAQDNQVLDLVHRLSERSVEMDEDLRGRYLPIHTAQFTVFNTVVELYPANHLPVHYSALGRKLSRSQRRACSLPPSPPPCVTLECQCAYATLTRPLYPDKILLMASKFHRDRLPAEITNTSLTRLAFKAVGVCSSLRLPFLQAMKVVEMSSVSSEQSWHSLISPLDDCVASDIGVHIENITTTSSKAKLMLLCEIISSLIATNNRQRYLAAHKTIYNTSLLHDAATTTDTIYLKLVVEHVKARRVVAALCSCVCVSVAACQLFAVRLPDKGDEWETMIVAAPDTDTDVTAPLLEALYQQPTVSLGQFPPIVTFALREVRFSADPLLYSWLLYTPSASFPTHQSTLLSHKSTESLKSARKVSESSLSSYVRRAPTPQESAPSSSERETLPSTQPNLDTIPSAPLPDRVATMYPQWKTMIVYGDVSQVSIYLPSSSLASPHPLTMEEGLQVALRQSSPPLQVLVIELPSISLRCTNHKQGLHQFTEHMPVRLPQNVWSVDKDNFPWTVTVADLHCYSLHGLSSRPLLKPVSFNCTIGTAPKFTDRNTMVSLALCVHLDTTPVKVKLSEEQVVLIVHLLMAQMKVLNVLMPSRSAEATVADTSSLKLISSDESSNISQSEDLAKSGGPVRVKLTGWLQWTLVRTTVCVYSRAAPDTTDELKLALDVEDIILSLDVERVYHKVKLKVATASVCHYTRPSVAEQWRRGVFHGLVMRGYDPDGLSDESQAPAGFLMATVTRAKCNNFHSRLGSPTKQPALGKKSLRSEKFITEIEIKMQPLDFVLSPTTLGMFLQVLDPLLSLLQAPSGGGSPKPSAPLHVSSLPLLYLDLMTIRVVLPTPRKQPTSHQPDVLILQFDGMTANPHPENPLCRLPLRPDLYHKGEKQRILNIPGSELEDRQYQFNLTSLRVQTGMWKDLEVIFAREVAVSSQHQNPALDWNEGRSPMFQVPAYQLMSPLIHSFNLSIIVAPAMIYLDKDIVCGHAVEINAVSDIVVCVTLDQLTLCGVLWSEMAAVLRLEISRQSRPSTSVAAPTTLLGPGPRTHPSLAEHDSGIDGGTESSFSHLRQADPNLPAVHAASPSGFSQTSGMVHSSLPSSIYPTPLVWPGKRSVVPCEVLVTGSAVSLSVFAVEHEEQPSYEPLFHTHVSQPHTFICRNTDNVFSCQMSAFDLVVRCGTAGHTVSAPDSGGKLFPQPLVETRSGDPHPLTGIPPSALTLRTTWDNDKPPKIDFDMGRPLRIVCTLEIIEYLKRLRALVFLSFFEPLNRCSDASAGITIQISSTPVGDDSDYYLRKLLRKFSKLTVHTQQIVLAVKSSTQDVDGCAELCLSMGGVRGQMTSTLSLQHAASGVLRLDNVTVSTRKMTSPKVRLLLNPWQLMVHTHLSWDSWLSPADPPLVSVSADSDILSLQLSPEQLICLQSLWRDYCPLLSPAGGPSEKPVLSRANSTGDSSGEEQHYHDDLQAGAFQFVDAANEKGRDEPPLTYQVVFWSSLPPTMAWRYPQPRAITKISIMPIPLKDVDEGVFVEPSCTLQYYSEPQSCYQDLVSFPLPQTSPRTVELPQYPPRVVAATWRVVIHRGGAAVAVHALAASVRIDSYFSPSLVPAVQVAVGLTAVQLSLWTRTDSSLPLPKPLDRYYLDRRFPEEHDFVTAVLEQANVTYSVWPKVSQQVSVRGRARVDVLNYHTLSSQCCLPPCPVAAAGYATLDSRQYSLVAGHCHLRLGPALCHSLAASLATWLPSQEQRAAVVVAPYVVCNNTCMPLRFRQAGSDEYISLQVFQCHLYSWRTTKHPMKLEFGLLELGPLEDNDWSKGLTLRPGSSSVIKLTTPSQDYAFIVSVKRLTPTVCQVVINGQLSLYNQLSVPVDVCMIPDSVGHQPSSLLVSPATFPPSVALDPRHGLCLRVRFSTAPAPWSGDIPLRPPAKLTKQWEVKIPLKEKGQFRSVWCNVVFEMIEDIYQMLVVFSPLYTIKSLLPCPANVVVETPALAASQVVPITGRGTVQHLDTPGLSEEKHNITFQLDSKVPASSPPVSLHYHMLDGSPAPPPPQTDVASLLTSLQSPALDDAPDWPYLGPDWAGVEWISTTQPDTLTHVRVKFSEDVVASNTLLVEVQPWALLVNTVGSHVYLQGRERTVCCLAHRAVISPPPLESTFQIGVELEGSVQLSDPIQLKRGPGFEMPHIPGLLPLCGFINITLAGNHSVCFMNVTSSEMSGLRLIHMRSSYVIASLSQRDLLVSAVAVKASDCQYTLPEEMLRQPVAVRPQPKSLKLKCQPLTEWKVLGSLQQEGELVSYLVVQAGAGGPVSCPARLPGGSERHSVPVVFPAAPDDALQQMLVMTVEQVDGQTNVLLWDQPHPQLTVHNHTHSDIVFAKAKTDNGGGFVADCEHIKWQLRVGAGETAHYNFPNNIGGPETVLPPSLPPAVIAVLSDDTNEVKWSDAVVLTQCTGRLLSLLGLPDMTLTVTKRGYTTHVTLSRASHTEILAVDIRGQLTRQLLGERRLSSLSLNSGDERPETNSEHESSPPPSFPPSESGTGEGPGLEISCYVDGLTATLLSQSDLGCECHEVAALTVDHVGITVHPHPHQDMSVREMKVHATVGDLQLDNQEFSSGGYDFPVVVMVQKPRAAAAGEVSMMSRHARSLVDEARGRGSAADLTVIVDVNIHATIAIQDVSVKFAPLQIYIEDKYLSHLKECFLNTLPSSLLFETSPKSLKRKEAHSVAQKKQKPKPAMRIQTENQTEQNVKQKYKFSRVEENESVNDVNKDLSEEEDLFNVSDPEDNQSPEEASSAEVVEVQTSYEADSVWTTQAESCRQEVEDPPAVSGEFPVAAAVVSGSRDLARPLRLRSLSIAQLDLLVSVHTSTKFYIALDHSPLQLAAFRRSSLFTTAYRLGHSLTLHYFFGAIYGTGWALGSLELLGAPGGLARSLGLGLRDFISLPLQGMLQGPSAFFTGIAHGSASLMHHIAAGTITSVTRLAASWARTLDRLTLDTRDLERSEQLRRLRPQTLSQGVVQGFTEFGISLIGAISSLAHHPLQYVMSDRPDHGLVSSVGLGLVGVFTRPLSGVAELVALTGEGLLSGVGWTNVPRVRHEPVARHSQCGADARLKYQWKLLPPSDTLLLAAEATSDCYEAITLLVTTGALYVVNTELDIVTRAVSLGDVQVVSGVDDPTLVALRLITAKEQAQVLSETRILEYVRESQRMLVGELSQLSPSPSPAPAPEPDEPHFQFFVNPQVRSHLLAVLLFAKSHATNRGFPAIS